MTDLLKAVGMMLCIVVVTTQYSIAKGIPKWAYPGTKLAEAQAVAEKGKKPLALVVADQDYMDRIEKELDRLLTVLKPHATVVILDGADGPAKSYITPLVWARLWSKEVTAYIPKAIITTPKMEGVYLTISKAQLGDAREFKEFQRELALVPGGSLTVDHGKGEEFRWRQKKTGHSYKGSFVSLKGNKLTLGYSGKESTRDLSELLPGEIAFAKALSFLNRQPEAWTNSEGKEIIATFVKLEDNKITIKLNSGEVVTFPIEKLSTESQAKALSHNGE